MVHKRSSLAFKLTSWLQNEPEFNKKNSLLVLNRCKLSSAVTEFWTHRNSNARVIGIRLIASRRKCLPKKNYVIALSKYILCQIIN